tara:strand:- start:3811 stop:4539 length:729 start_codon:yes stop_codon:yes gene_type:complete
MRYIGVRTCKTKPDCDNNYWGSSKYVPKDIKKTGTKTILKVFSKREDAVLHEIELHSLYDVARNEKFWNRSKQTCTGFDTSGTKLTEQQKVRCGDHNRGRTFTEEHRNNISKGRTGLKHSKEVCEIFSKAQLKYTNSERYIHPNQGKVFTAEEKIKSSEAHKKAYEKALISSSKAKLAPRFKPWFISHPTYTEVMYDVTQVEYAEQNKIPRCVIVNALKRSKGLKRLSNRGTFKNCIMGYIP